jgi:hypothetical protein
LKGKVKDGSAPLMYVIPWPMPIVYREEAHLSAYSAFAEAGGEFTKSGLLPGEYRVFASTLEAADTTVLRRLAERAERVRLGRGETRTVVIPLLDPTR